MSFHQIINLVVRHLLENKKDDYHDTKYYKNSLNSLKSVPKSTIYNSFSHLAWKVHKFGVFALRKDKSLIKAD